MNYKDEHSGFINNYVNPFVKEWVDLRTIFGRQRITPKINQK